MITLAEPTLETVEQVLAGALAWRDGSLVIHRRGILVEFKTELLAPGLTSSREAGCRSWQVGPFEGHHCHLDLAAVRQVWFDAEPVSCQGGRLNYTVWFLAVADCGNPYRPEGLFSVTLNGPYRRDGSLRCDLVGPVYALYEAYRDHYGVSASLAFLSSKPSA